MRRRVWMLGLALAACGGEETTATGAEASTVCDQAKAHLEACFPGQAAATECHGATAQQVLDASCDELAGLDDKADGWMCFWTPWLCSTGGSSTDTYTIRVGTSRCAQSIFGDDDCSGYYSSSCTAVGLYKDGEEIDRQFSSLHGSVRFEVEEKGDYEVRVFERGGDVATHIVGSFQYSYEPAVQTVTVGEDEEVRLGFDLPHDSEAKVMQCAPVNVDFTVETATGERVDSKQVEWEWFMRFLQADGTVKILRPFSIHPDATGEDDYVNRATFHRIYQGEHLVEFIRMEIPEWRRENNPDYEYLLERYAADVDPVVVPFELKDEMIPDGAELVYGVIDPLTE